MVQCPACEDAEKIHYTASYLTDFYVEFQCICGNCGNVFRESVNMDE